MIGANAAKECVTSKYKGSYSAVSHDATCFVTYNNKELTWFGAAEQCIWFDSHLASFDVTSTSVNFVKTAHIPPSKCSWVGLVKEFFYWTEVQREYTHDVEYKNTNVEKFHLL